MSTIEQLPEEIPVSIEYDREVVVKVEPTPTALAKRILGILGEDDPTHKRLWVLCLVAVGVLAGAEVLQRKITGKGFLPSGVLGGMHRMGENLREKWFRPGKPAEAGDEPINPKDL